ncbi:4-hydroxy-3-methylbut-2-en-1-yl diphosphate synthase [Balneicella halophila]|uniref:4-hydroxy-3-methylbut-2-en-1-yl diphosphate synthase (flavodoxin) n=1 Tax=Balneicella halophila TaxID=1537566 RepID=A0A7L4UR16_BALHA|nr:(E)-4-hydroxy-3-methylbut-2-enyl-diphosphate synthase [Balneicella halophila]PVX52109.1 4-hydroxy-3-methylbut-2-en-1-yl diphosphate synthase [Balneicella halophila]
MKYTTTQTKVGDILIGGDSPIVIQSMTTTTTTDVDATVDEAIRIHKAGAKLVRITAQGVKEAEALKDIKEKLKERGYNFPISADIHFNYKAAYTAAKYVDKVRINPGNFIKHGKTESFEEGVDKIKERFIPLLDLLKENHVALRIGVNHGSLSERMMVKYGDTPKGIVASCMEYLNICREENFHNLVISIKSSNTVLMIKAVRLLVTEMRKADMAYPLHLGVTEAGEGEDGRLKSAVGTGTLLNQGIGDTIRVSLTEDPECEPPVAQKLIDFTEKGDLSENLKLDFEPRKILKRGDFSNANAPRVLVDARGKKSFSTEDLGYKHGEKGIRACDYVIVEKYSDDLPKTLKQIIPIEEYEEGKGFALYNEGNYQKTSETEDLFFIEVDVVESLDMVNKLNNDDSIVLIAKLNENKPFQKIENFFKVLNNLNLQLPVVVNLQSTADSLEDLQIQAAANLGNSFVDGLASGILLTNSNLPLSHVRETAFGVLQASRARTTKTEFISCPGCGRTLFSLQEVTAKVKAHFNHLNHLKIGVMGCIVNGPGEMGDAHYGYVGAGPGKINLYKGTEVMKRNIPSGNAIEALEELIKEHGDWVEPNES